MSALIEAIKQEFAAKSKDEQWAEARWRLIMKIMTHQRVVIAIFGQTLPASFLALSSTEDLNRKATELENMTPESFTQFMASRQEKHQDPEVSSPKKAHAQDPSTTAPESKKAIGRDALSEVDMPKKDVV